MRRGTTLAAVSFSALLLSAALATGDDSSGDRQMTASPSPVRGLLVAEGDQQQPMVSVITLTGQPRRVPETLRLSPLGLSPDGRLLARARVRSDLGIVELATVRTGRFRTLLKARCSSCRWGPDPSFAWSGDGSLLAAAATPERGPTILRLYARGGRLLRSFRLPGIDRAQSQPAHRVREAHRLISWSSDGSRLLLLRLNEYIPIAIVALNVRSGALRTLASFGHKDAPTQIAWSPNGRLVALDGGEGFDSHDFTFAVIDVSTGRPLLQCTSASPCKWGRFGPLAWAADSRSLLTLVGGKIERLSLTGRRSTLFKGARPGFVFIATAGGLVYDEPVYHGDSFVRDTLYFVDVLTRRRRTLYVTRRNAIVTARPLLQFP